MISPPVDPVLRIVLPRNARISISSSSPGRRRRSTSTPRLPLHFLPVPQEPLRLPFHPVHRRIHINGPVSSEARLPTAPPPPPLTRRRRLAGTRPMLLRCVSPTPAAASPLYTQFINITFSPLPVSLVSFEAKRNGQQVLTSWVTASEVNNDFSPSSARPTVRCSRP